MNEHSLPAFVTWFYTAFFAGFGVLVAVRSDMLTRSTPCLRTRNCEDAARIDAVVERRRDYERLSDIPRYVAAACAFAVAALEGFRLAPPALLYGMFCTMLAVLSATTYLQLRNTQRKRVAVLAPRSPETVIPPAIVAVAAVAAATPLVFVGVPGLTIPSLVVCASTIVTLAIALRLTSLPALLQGVDLPAETLVDDRLRFLRSFRPLIWAIVQPFFFCSQAFVQTSAAAATVPLIVAYYLTLVAFFGVCGWYVSRIRSKVTLAAA
jgi:hypothetical protein